MAEAASVGETVKVAKMWRACRSSMEASYSARKEPMETRVEATLDEPTQKSLREAWARRHDSLMTDARLLVESLQGSNYRKETAKPHRLSVYSLEQFRVMASLETGCHASLLVHPGQAAKGSAVITDTINRSFKISIRGRALFSTIAYCPSTALFGSVSRTQTIFREAADVRQ